MTLNKIITILFLSLFLNNFHSQEKLENGQSSKLYLHVEGGVKKEQPKTVEQIIAGYDMDKVNKMISSYERKKDYITNDPNQNTLAKENGWFDRINYELSLLYKRKEAINSAIKK